MKKSEHAMEALARATCGQSLANYGPILEGFAAKGIPMADVLPRENVFTFNAWVALGRCVRKGEHGVKVATFVPMTKTDKDTGEVDAFRRPKTTTVFHVSQTDPIQ